MFYNGVRLEGLHMDYKKEMIQMIKEIENDKIINMLYNFVKSFYKEEKAGR